MFSRHKPPQQEPTKEKPPFAPTERQAIFLDSIDRQIELLFVKIDAEIALALAQK